MTYMLKPTPHWLLLIALMSGHAVWAESVVWSCSRSEAHPEVFEKLRAYRLEDLSAKDDEGIVITLSDLYSAYGGQTIRMGRSDLTVCTLPSNDPIQTIAMDLLGYNTKDVEAAAQLATAKLVLVPTIHRMQKCIVENHPAIGFFENVVENERVGPCF